MRDPHQVAVVGVTGYSGFELARLLLRHPAVKHPVFYVRETHGARCLGELFPQLRGSGEAPLRPLSIDAITSSAAGAAFLATPHQASAELAPQLLAAGLRVVDLSGAFRFRSADTFTSWYKLPAPDAATLSQAAYAASGMLALRPLAAFLWIAAGSTVVCDCKSGASGAGKEPRRDLQFVELDENFKAYNLFSQRHTPEILEHTR